jgi:hypothetical protein
MFWLNARLGATGRESNKQMTALITSVEHALAAAASDTVKVAKFVETSVLPALKTTLANSSTIEAVTGLVSPQAANIERAGFAVLGLVINALDAAGAAAGANGLNISLDAQLVADIKAIAAAVKGAVPVSAVPATPAK